MLAGLKLCCVFPTMAKEVLTFCCLVLYLLVIGVESRSTHPSYIPTTPRYPTMGPSTTCHVDGNVYNVGDTFGLTPCVGCICNGDSTYPPYWCCGTMCEAVGCVDAYRPPGGCCWECPNGVNCYTPWGECMDNSQPLVNETIGVTCVCDPSFVEHNYHDPETTPDPLIARCFPTDDESQ